MPPHPKTNAFNNVDNPLLPFPPSKTASDPATQRNLPRHPAPTSVSPIFFILSCLRLPLRHYLSHTAATTPATTPALVTNQATTLPPFFCSPPSPSCLSPLLFSHIDPSAVWCFHLTLRAVDDSWLVLEPVVMSLLLSGAAAAAAAWLPVIAEDGTTCASPMPPCYRQKRSNKACLQSSWWLRDTPRPIMQPRCV